MRAPETPSTVWSSGTTAPAFGGEALLAAVQRVREPAHVVREHPGGRVGVALGGAPIPVERKNGVPTFPLLATLPALYPEWLGDRSFAEVHGCRFPYVAGAMANGIHTARMTVAMARAGMMGFFGAAGLAPSRVAEGLDHIVAELGPDAPSWGSNLIHSPQEPGLEAAVVALYLERGVRRVSASAYMNLTPMVVRYAFHGVTQDPQGRIRRRNHLFAKISRAEVARRFMSPPPGEMLDALVQRGELTADEARLARLLPVAEDVTVEADSGGHTDNRPLPALFPIIQNLRDELVTRHGYTRPIRVGAAGGLGTPSAVASAFALGAAYVLTGSVNQAAVESGLSEDGRRLLAAADMADVVMAPAADMFELGVKVQVLKRGTMFAVRAQRLYETYLAHDGLEDIPPDTRERLEKQVLSASLDEIWEQTRAFWSHRDPRELERCERDAKHRMALCFRWYLGKSSRWAIDGDATRRMDYQIWCGPAMGAFNDWTRGTFLAEPENRTVVQIARNLLEGAAVVTRAQQLRTYGVPMPGGAFVYRPRPLA